MLLLLLTGLVVPMLSGCATVQHVVQDVGDFALRNARLQGIVAVPSEKDEAFSFAVEAVRHRSFRQAANAAWNFLDAADPDDPRYDRGLRLLAQSAEGLELGWGASMLYRQIAQSRHNLELIPDAMRGIERAIKSGVYDRDALVTSFIAAEEFGYLPADLEAFIHFHKGLDLLRKGEDAWAEEHFSAIPEASSYAVEAAYVEAVAKVAQGKLEEAEESLTSLLEHDNVEVRTEQDIHRTLARLAFEEERYDDALRHYETLRQLAPDDPEILLEMAWTYYYLGNARKTVGLLVALDAPVHRRYISPERYVLEALALRRLCQFNAARLSAARLERRHAGALKALEDGSLPGQIPEMRAAAKLRGASQTYARFVDELETEHGRLGELKLNERLRQKLEELYARGLEDAHAKLNAQIDQDLADLTEELLSAREGVRLIVHELAVSLLRGRRKPQGSQEEAAVDVPIAGDLVLYPFEGEYWTDELDDLVVFMEDRCID